jgi:predicted ferric reductase
VKRFFESKFILFIAIFIALLPVLFWALSEPLSYRFFGLFDTLTSLGQIFGLVGISLFSLVLILSARLKIFDRYFGGLGRVYKFHHNLGIAAFIFILLHPLILSLRLLFVSKESFIDFIFSFDDLGIILGKLGVLGLVILMALTLYFRKVLKYQIWKLSHKFMGLIFIAGGIHMFISSSDFSSNPLLLSYMILIFALGVGAYLYRTVFYLISAKRFIYKVSKINFVGENVLEITMSPVDKIMNYNPGQFIFVSFDNKEVGKEPHPFSLISNPKDREIQIAVKSLGDYTGRLSKLKIGDLAKIEGPFGVFDYKKSENKYQIWIAGGIGITPFLSMARSIDWNEYKVDFYYSFKTKSDGVYLDELEKIAKNNKNLSLFPWVSEKNGFLSAGIVKNLSNGLLGKDIFICGPASMMKALIEGFLKEKVPLKNIHTEEFSI